MITTINNKHNKLNVPNLRFPEFQGEWSVTTLQKDCIVNPTNEKIADKFVYVDLESVKQGQLYKYQILTKDNAPSRAQRVLHTDDILFQCVRPYQMNNYMVKGTMSDIQWVASTGYAQIRTQTDYPSFLYYVLNTSKYNKAVMVRCTGSSYPAINSEDLSKIPFYKCGIAEQKKIADFLSLIDERIATQNKIIDKLQTLIRGIMVELQKQGLKNGTWKKFILADVLSERSELNIDLHQVFSVSVSKGVVNQVEYLGRSFSAKDTSKYHVVHYGDIVYTKSPTGSFPYGIVKQSFNHDNVAVSPLYGVYKPKNFSTGMFLHQYFMSEVNTLNYLHPLIQKGAKNTINITNQRFLENRVAMPINADTLLVISKLLRSLNYKIEYQQSLLLQYQKQKQYLLRQMFI